MKETNIHQAYEIAKERYERAFAAFTEHFAHFGEDAST